MYIDEDMQHVVAILFTRRNLSSFIPAMSSRKKCDSERMARWHQQLILLNVDMSADHIGHCLLDTRDEFCHRLLTYEKWCEEKDKRHKRCLFDTDSVLNIFYSMVSRHLCDVRKIQGCFACGKRTEELPSTFGAVRNMLGMKNVPEDHVLTKSANVYNLYRGLLQ